MVTVSISLFKKVVQYEKGEHRQGNNDDGFNGADDIQHRGSDYLQQNIIIALLTDYPKQYLIKIQDIHTYKS